MQACRTVDDAYQALGSLIAPLFPTSSGGIFMFNEAGDRVDQVVAWGSSPPSAPGLLPLDCWALHQRPEHPSPHICETLGCTHAVESAKDSTLCLPLLVQGETLGLFYLSVEDLSPPIQQLARTVVDQVALALANLYLRETLKQQSIHDLLTGLYNRRYLEEALNQEIQRAQRHRHSIGVIIIDIDHFKGFNDTYGHDAGDRFLEAMGRLLSASVRGSDIACRYGGEEMTLVLPESSLAVTLARAEAIRRAMGEIHISYGGVTIDRLSVSLGVAEFPIHGNVGADVVKSADAALYQAKANGRNQVAIAAIPDLELVKP